MENGWIVLDNPNFWDVHGLLFLIFIAFFPRLTMLLATPWGGFLWWLGLIFVPRIQVAILATCYYWDTNPVLCIFAWLIALCGESGEKGAAANRLSQS
ncbi:MAG: hypothetical protein KDD64_08280 [Bdellovibrionales bacterium]|nr:hypothetical protein [Bdellovibrionales bacterium]